MLKHAMPTELIKKFDLKRLSPPPGSPSEGPELDNFECYNFPMPDRKVNCWFQIFPETMITNPNMMIFSAGAPDPAAISVSIDELWTRTPEEMQRYIVIGCKKFKHEQIKRAQMN